MLNISHIIKWVYTSVRGEICYPCTNDVTLDTLDGDASMLNEFDPDVNLCTAWYTRHKNIGLHKTSLIKLKRILIFSVLMFH